MTPLRQRMGDAMVTRGFAARTQEIYVESRTPSFVDDACQHTEPQINVMKKRLGKASQTSSNWTSRNLPFVVVGLRCSPELRFAPLLTLNFDGRLQRKLTGSRRHTSDIRLSELPPPNLAFKRECLGRLYGDDFIELNTRSRPGAAVPTFPIIGSFRPMDETCRKCRIFLQFTEAYCLPNH